MIATSTFGDSTDATMYITPEDLVEYTSTASYSDNSEVEEFEEVKINHKNRELKLSVPKGSLEYDPRQKVPLYCPSFRVNNGRRR